MTSVPSYCRRHFSGCIFFSSYTFFTQFRFNKHYPLDVDLLYNEHLCPVGYNTAVDITDKKKTLSLEN